MHYFGEWGRKTSTWKRAENFEGLRGKGSRYPKERKCPELERGTVM